MLSTKKISILTNLFSVYFELEKKKVLNLQAVELNIESPTLHVILVSVDRSISSDSILT